VSELDLVRNSDVLNFSGVIKGLVLLFHIRLQMLSQKTWAMSFIIIAFKHKGEYHEYY
jgi:hypothetical protein